MKNHTILNFLLISFIIGLSFINSSNLNQIEKIESTIDDLYSSVEREVDIAKFKPRSHQNSNSTHPLSKNETRVVTLDEMAIFPHVDDGTTLPSSGWIADDLAHNFNKTYDFAGVTERHKINCNGPEWSMSGIFPTSSDFAAGDVDGDGADEIIVASKDFNLYIYENSGNHSNPIPITHDFQSHPNWAYRAVTTGDFDGDGFEEIAVLQNELGGDGDWGKLRLWVYDYILNTTLYNDFRLQDTDIYGASLDIAAGDFDSDGSDEIIIAVARHHGYGTNVWLIEDYNQNFIISPNTFNTFPSWSPTWYAIPHVAVDAGDFDGDGIDEFIIASVFDGDSQGLDGNWVFHSFYPLIKIYDDASTSYDETILILSGIDGNYAQIRSGDVDGDGRDEIGICYSRRTAAERWPLISNQIYHHGMGYILDYSVLNSEYQISHTWQKADFIDFGFDMGDLDCDGKDELVFTSSTSTTVLDDADHDYQVLLDKDTRYYGKVVCGDFDGDGIRLNYTGEYWNITGPPGIVAVLAAPPTYSDIDQNHAGSYTSFGQSSTQGTGESTEIGVSLGATYSVEQDVSLDPFDFFEIEFSFSNTISEEFSRTNTNTHAVTTSQKFSTGASTDAVIYHSTDYTCFKYQITSHPYNPELIGKYMTIDIPYSPVLFKTTLEDFDNTYGLDIRSNTFDHTPGKPWTYPAKTELLSQHPVRWETTEMYASLGSSAQEASIEITEGDSLTMQTSKSSEYAEGLAVGGIGYSYSKGIFSSKAYEISSEEGTIFECGVGDIADVDVHNELEYSFSLCVYFQSHPSGYTFQVLNYWVEGATDNSQFNISDFYSNNSNWVNIGGAGIAGGIIVSLLLLVFRKKK